MLCWRACTAACWGNCAGATAGNVSGKVFGNVFGTSRWIGDCVGTACCKEAISATLGDMFKPIA